MSERAAYLRDGTAIYERSFAIIRAEADLTRFSTDEADVAVRMIHACGVVELAPHIVMAHDLVDAARRALAAGAARLTIVGRHDGCAVISNGSVRDAPVAFAAANELPSLIAEMMRDAKCEAAHV